MVAFDDTTLEYVKGAGSRRKAPSGTARAYWRTLKSDPDAKFDREVTLDAREIRPHVTWGTSPEMVVTVEDSVPDPDKERDSRGAKAWSARCSTWASSRARRLPTSRSTRSSSARAPIRASRTCAPRPVVKGRKGFHVRLALVVPGSGLVKQQAEREGLDRVFRDAGFEWREPGCSMCLGMNPDRLEPGERCASTSNRNFEGRQGTGGRTHLVSPAMAAAAAIAGHFVDIRKWTSSPS